ncbi:YggT family protein [uncultured Treponema sp.]|uniref:YggT family protein n=1 Tax=uncultured Treponema sp. TaxID=162155 RepID=UPI0025942EAA|nr:YggT family protein [uncultured Treponema sp.]
MRNIFQIIAMTVDFYSFICLIRFFLTWFPKANYSTAGRILSFVCDPYLNIFRKLRFLNFRGLDFSPALALCALYAVSGILSSLSHGQLITVGYLLAVVLSLIWSLISSVTKFLIVLLIIRLVAMGIMRLISRLISRKNGYRAYNPIWDKLDSLISPFAYKISGIFTKKFIPFTTALIISTVFSLITVKLADFLVSIVCNLLVHLPF